MIKRSFKIDFRDGGQSTLTNGIAGYAFKFNETVNYMGQLERFSPDLKVDMNQAGTFLFRDHNPERVLARVPDTLKFTVDKEGLRFTADYIDTPLWKETVKLLSKGVLNGASVGFSSSKERQDDNNITIYERIKLFEVSLVTWPAYESSEVNNRNKTLKYKDLPPELFL